MSMDKYSQLVVSSNEDVTAESLLSLHGDNIEYSVKQDMVTNMGFEAITPPIQKNLFHQCTVYFANKL